MKRVRGGSGLGDSLYLRPIVEHLLSKGDPVTVCSNYPDVFRGADCKVEPFGRNNINVLGHYTLGKSNPATNQWEDVCASAKVGKLPLRFTWNTINRQLVDGLEAKAAGRKIILVHGGRTPMARTDGFGAELLPDKRAFDVALDALDGCMLVQIGKGATLYPLRSDVDLSGKTSVADLIDIAAACDGAVGQCSFIIPLCEVFDKPLLCVWAHRGLSTGRHQYVSSITPKKVLSKSTSKFVIDDWTEDDIRKAAHEFRN